MVTSIPLSIHKIHSGSSISCQLLFAFQYSQYCQYSPFKGILIHPQHIVVLLALLNYLITINVLSCFHTSPRLGTRANLVVDKCCVLIRPPSFVYVVVQHLRTRSERASETAVMVTATRPTATRTPTRVPVVTCLQKKPSS